MKPCVPALRRRAVGFLTLVLLAAPITGVAQPVWTPTSTVGAPEGREDRTAVWTGSRMIVWGGSAGSNDLNTGGVYDPATDTWTPTSTVGAPEGRSGHTAVWTGSRMIVWGGRDGSNDLNTGGVYDPATDTWTPTITVGAPEGRKDHTAVWTGSRMIVWGGYEGANGLPGTGGVYDPASDTWTATSTVGAPGHHLTPEVAVWTGSRMIVWPESIFTLGPRVYDPASDTWTAMSDVGAPEYREWHTAVWTGSRMIVWGGWNFEQPDPFPRSGGVYDPATDTWTATSRFGAPVARLWHTAVWTGSRMIVWGGSGPNVLNTGGVYDPAADTWTATSTVGAPDGRSLHTAVWTGSRMIVWGGYGELNTGGVYDDPAFLAPVGLAVEDSASNDNGILEPGEAAGIEPSWRAAVNTLGVMGLGVAGPDFTLSDNSATYGNLTADVTVSCATSLDCYEVVADGVRTSTHWDLSLEETLSAGVTHDWALHVGSSFDDVPVGSPFYPFIETLLHHSVTAGCSPTGYCPTSATTRAQMAVFVLKAKEGTSYSPPPCGSTPVFGDVPVTSPFCPWIEELARRKVVAGCGNDNYCPDQSVSREQMAVLVLKTLDPRLSPPECTTPVFGDVPASSGFCKWVEELYRREVVVGCSPGSYCPSSSVTREQMGVFIGRGFGLSLYGP